MHRFEDPGGRQTRRSGRKELKRSILCIFRAKSIYFMNIMRSVRGNVHGETKLTTGHESSALRGKNWGPKSSTRYSTHAPLRRFYHLRLP